MKHYFLSLLFVGMLSCSTPPKEPTREEILIEAAKKDLKNYLVDPNSLEVYRTVLEPANAGIEYLILDYGAKNGFGGMVRDVQVFEFIGNKIVDRITIFEYEKRKQQITKPKFSFKDNPAPNYKK